jgi:hypothetical protein
MPGYEYQFVALAVNPEAAEVGAFVEPIETQSVQYEHFVSLARNGWRVNSMVAHPRAGSFFLVVLEREIAPPA